ncbi:MAG: FkbM family methyltransferase [Bacteroidetes bacterium]|nr:FkbM family methyltransferase [Bacteroidota bacterium]
MILTFLIDSIKMKWLLFRRKRMMKAPPSPSRQNRMERSRLEIIRLKSRMQEYLCHNLFGKRVAGVVFDSYNGVLINGVADVEISQHLGNWGAYDHRKIEFLQGVLKEGDVLYVAGAHIGTVGIPLSRKVRQVYAFEASPSTFALLQWNVVLNKRDNIKVYNYALYDREEDILFYNSKANSGGSKIRPAAGNYLYDYDEPDVVTVSGKLLDKVREQESLDYPDVIVMDIEGAEFNALLGGQACLENARVLYIEFVPHHLDNIGKVGVQEFTENILRYFMKMIVADEAVRGAWRIYEGAEILSRLEGMYRSGMAADLLFYK